MWCCIVYSGQNGPDEAGEKGFHDGIGGCPVSAGSYVNQSCFRQEYCAVRIRLTSKRLGRPER